MQNAFLDANYMNINEENVAGALLHFCISDCDLLNGYTLKRNDRICLAKFCPFIERCVHEQSAPLLQIKQTQAFGL